MTFAISTWVLTSGGEIGSVASWIEPPSLETYLHVLDDSCVDEVIDPFASTFRSFWDDNWLVIQFSMIFGPF